MELAYTTVLKTVAERIVGSNPTIATIMKRSIFRMQDKNKRKQYEANRQAAIERMERRKGNMEDMLKYLAFEKISNRDFSLKWNDMTVVARTRMHELITAGYAKIYTRKTGDYSSEYFVQISDEGLAKVLTDKL